MSSEVNGSSDRLGSAILAALGFVALAYLAGGFAPFTSGHVPGGEAGWPALAWVALALIARRQGVRLEEANPFRAALDWLRRLDARRLGVAYLVFVAIVGGFAMRRYSAFEAHAYDLAIFDQAIWATSRGHWLFSSLKGGMSLLGDHFSPILILFAPLDWIFTDPRALVLLQTAILGLGAFPLLNLARRLLGQGALAALFPLAFLLAAPIRTLALADFHPETVAVPALLWALDGLHSGNRGRVAFGVLIALACKETCALAVIGLGLWALLVLRRPWMAAVLVVLGAGVFLLEVKLALPYFAGKQTPYLDRYGHLGSSLGEVLLAPVRRPIETASLLVWPWVKLEGLIRLLAPFGLMALAAPAALAGAAPNYLANAMSHYAPMHNVGFQYHAEMAAFVAAASVLGAAKLAHGGPRRRQLLGIAVATCALVQVGRPELARLWATPITSRHERMAAYLAAIPPEAAVSADTRSATHLSRRLPLFHFPRKIDQAEWVAVDTRALDHAWHVSPEARAAAVAALPSKGFALVVDDDGFKIFRRERASLDGRK
jgi:uncharacterized membrane protein